MLTFSSSIGPDVRIQFSAKPDARVRAMLKVHGFRWSPAAGLWWRKRVAGAADVLLALRRLIGPRKPDGACWRCQSPEGYFRPHGAATPVHCDACHAALQAEEPTPALGGSSFVHADRFDLEHEDRCARACGLFGGES